MPLQLFLPFFRGERVASERAPRAAQDRLRPVEARVERVQGEEEIALRANVARRLAHALGADVRLSITDNRRTMISSGFRQNCWHVRLHHMFVQADAGTLDAVARFVKSGGRRGGAPIDDFIARHSTLIRVEEGPERLRARGDHHDLAAILEDLNRRYFAGEVDVRITWGKNVSLARRRRSIHLGTYQAKSRLIRIHPALDQAWVPGFFVGAVVFHEMLHHVVPPPVRNGRRYYHCAEFRRREREYPDHERALVWEKENIGRLLRGRPPPRMV